MATVTFPLRQHLFPYSSTLLLLRLRYPHFHFHHSFSSIPISDNRLFLPSWPLLVCRFRRWDSNAEYYGRNDEGEAADDEFDGDTEQRDDVLRDYIDSIWIWKVFQSYGWLLPPIILSLLLITGLKAFLMALALPVGQSTVVFAFQRIQNLGKNKSKHSTDTKKRRSRVRASRKVKLGEARLWVGSQGATKRTKENQAWFSKNDVSTYKMDNSIADYGGWDELENGTQPISSSRSSAEKLSGSPTIPREKRKLSWKPSENGTPLLLRLLVAIFPFFKFLD